MSKTHSAREEEGTMTFRDSGEAFEQAIREGRLSASRGSDNYAGSYMYMGTDDAGRDLFKSIVTRLYDV
jgi:ABC-type dipeptide/oligopeptide/nickel transport system permease subunit